MAHKWLQTGFFQRNPQWAQDAVLASSSTLELPIDCVMAGQQPYPQGRSRLEAYHGRVTTKIVAGWSRRAMTPKPPVPPVKNSRGGYDL